MKSTVRAPKPSTVRIKFSLSGKADGYLEDVNSAQRSDLLKAALSTYREMQKSKAKRLRKKIYHA